MTEKIVITQSRKSGIAYSVAAIVFSLLCLLFLVLDLRELGGLFAQMSDVVYYIFKAIFLIGFVFFGYAFYYLSKRTKDGVTLLCVDENGVTDNSSAIGFGFMPWSDIEDIFLTDFMGQTFIDLRLRNPDYYIEKLPAWKQSMIKANLKMGMQAVSITLNATKENSREICARMQNIMRQVKGK